MPSYGNPLYANGVPTYSGEISALGDVFKALAPNPLRDLQIQGYANNARLAKLKGDVYENQTASNNRAADLFANNPQGAYIELMRGGNDKMLKVMPGMQSGYYASQAMVDGPDSVNPDVQDILNVGNKMDAAKTYAGFTANQDRQTEEANQKNDTVQRGQNIRSADSRYATNVGSADRRYATNVGADSATYRVNAGLANGGSTGGVASAASGGTGKVASVNLPPAAVLKGMAATRDNLLSQYGVELGEDELTDLSSRAMAHLNSQRPGERDPAGAVLAAVNEVFPAGLSGAQEGHVGAIGSFFGGESTNQILPRDKRPTLPPSYVSTVAPGGAAAAAGGGRQPGPLGKAFLSGDLPMNKRVTSADLQRIQPQQAQAPAGPAAVLDAAPPPPAAQMSAPPPAAIAAPPAAAPTSAPAPSADPMADDFQQAAVFISQGIPREKVIDRLLQSGYSKVQIMGAGI